MMEASLQQRTENFRQIYVQMKESFRYRMGDRRTLMLVSSIYAVSDKTFNLATFQSLAQAIKKRASLFSPLRSYQRFTMAAMLDTHFTHPAAKLEELMQVYDSLVASGFRRGIFTYLSAYLLLSQDETSSTYLPRDESSLPEGAVREGSLRNSALQNEIQQVLDIYHGMREKHFFLTSSRDYPLAVLLAKQDRPADEIMTIVEEYYVGLSERGFRRGSQLRYLSHILCMDGLVDIPSRVEECVSLKEALREADLKPTPLHYADIGVLALLENGIHQVAEVSEIYDTLHADKQFRRYRDIALTTAVHLTVSEHLTDSTLLETGIFKIIESILQAQQAAMIAAVAGAAAASSASSSST